MSSLSKREKIMLYIMALIIIVAVGIKFLLLPLSDRYQNTQEELFALELQQQEIAGVLNSGEALQEEILQTKTNIEAQRAKLYTYMMSDQVVHMLTSLMQSYSLTPLSLSVSDPAVISAVPYGTVEQGASDGEAEGEAAATVYAGLPGYQAYLSVTGTLDNLARFTDDAAKNPALRIDRFTSRQDMSAGIYRIDLVLVVYMNDYEG